MGRSITDPERSPAKSRGSWSRRDDAPAEARLDQGRMGVIAQELEEVLPEPVATDDQGRKKVDCSAW